jgi:hypothetical protein
MSSRAAGFQQGKPGIGVNERFLTGQGDLRGFQEDMVVPFSKWSLEMCP